MARQYSRSRQQISSRCRCSEAARPPTASLTSQVISLKNAHKAVGRVRVHASCWSRDHADAPPGHQRSPPAPTRPARLSTVWANEDTAATDTLVKQTAGASYAVDVNDVKNKQVVFEIDPSTPRCRQRLRLRLLHDRDVLAGDQLRVGNRLSAERTYQQATPPSCHPRLIVAQRSSAGRTPARHSTITLETGRDPGHGPH
jgi:hypothetical protein